MKHLCSTDDYEARNKSNKIVGHLGKPEDTTYSQVATLNMTTSEDDDACTACSNLNVDNNWVASDGCDAWYHLGCQEPRISGYVKTI